MIASEMYIVLMYREHFSMINFLEMFWFVGAPLTLIIPTIDTKVWKLDPNLNHQYPGFPELF